MENIKRFIFKALSLILFFIVFIVLYKNIMTRSNNVVYVSVFGFTYEVRNNTVDIVQVTDNVRGNDYIYYKDNNSNEYMRTKLIKINNGDFVITDGKISKSQVIGKVRFSFPLLAVIILFPLLLIVYLIFTFTNKKDIFEKNEIVKNDIPDNIFKNSKEKPKEEIVTGLTVTISLKDVELLEENSKKNNKDEVEVLYLDDYFDDTKYDTDKETIDIVMSILKCRNNFSKSRINKDWLEKYQYVYKLTALLYNDNTDEFIKEVNNPPFKEEFNYDLDRIGLTKVIRNKIYNLPIFGLLRLLIYSVLYNDEVLFDGIYKILKYKVKNDNGSFVTSRKMKGVSKKELSNLLNYMRDISNKFDNNNAFNLDRIDKLIRISNY